MHKTAVIEILNEKHQYLFDWLESHPIEKWAEGPQNKWNTGEHIVHLIQSESALNKALRLPKIFLKYKFGTNNRANRGYHQIVKKYEDKLAANPGVVANISKKMPTITPATKTAYLSKLDKEKKKLIHKFNKWSEADLDKYLLPHPLLGRMTIREILLWTAYHTEHHFNILKAKY